MREEKTAPGANRCHSEGRPPPCCHPANPSWELQAPPGARPRPCLALGEHRCTFQGEVGWWGESQPWRGCQLRQGGPGLPGAALEVASCSLGGTAVGCRAGGPCCSQVSPLHPGLWQGSAVKHTFHSDEHTPGLPRGGPVLACDGSWKPVPGLQAQPGAASLASGAWLLGAPHAGPRRSPTQGRATRD